MIFSFSKLSKYVDNDVRKIEKRFVLFVVEIRRRRIGIFNSRPILILDHASIIFRTFHRDEKSVISLFSPLFFRKHPRSYTSYGWNRV